MTTTQTAPPGKPLSNAAVFIQMPRNVKLVFAGWVITGALLGYMLVRDLLGLDLDPALDGGATLLTAVLGCLLVCFAWLVPMGLYFRRRFVRRLTMVMSVMLGLMFVGYFASNARYLVLVTYDIVGAVACVLGACGLAFSALSLQVALRSWPQKYPGSDLRPPPT